MVQEGDYLKSCAVGIRLMYNQIMKISLTQKRINIINLSIAGFAILIALPSMVNQIRQLFGDIGKEPSTTVSYYSPPDLNGLSASVGDKCWGSLVSGRSDAYRCMKGNSILDPCFWVEKYNTLNKSYFYCPNLEQRDDKDIYLELSDGNVDRSYVQNGSSIDLSRDLPWLVYLLDNTSCRLVSGAVGAAFGNKGNIYSCKSQKYSSMTNDYVEGNKHIFACRLSNENVFKRCSAKMVVY